MGIVQPAVIDGLTQGFLLQRYDNPVKTPKFHWTIWEAYCGDDKYVAAAAPRGHAKTSSLTHAYTLAMVLLGEKDFVLIVSDTETQAIEFLGDMKTELLENEGLRETFGVKKLLKDTENNIVIRFNNGQTARILAKGSEQKVRGLKWKGKRPN